MPTIFNDFRRDITGFRRLITRILLCIGSSYYIIIAATGSTYYSTPALPQFPGTNKLGIVSGQL